MFISTIYACFIRINNFKMVFLNDVPVPDTIFLYPFKDCFSLKRFFENVAYNMKSIIFLLIRLFSQPQTNSVC